MHPCRRDRNLGMLPSKDSKIRPSAGALVSGLTRRGILVCQRVRAHIFDKKRNPRCRRDVISMIIVSSFLGRMPVLHGAICKYGSSFTKRALKFREWETQIHLTTMSKRNTNLRRNYPARFAGTNKYSAI